MSGGPTPEHQRARYADRKARRVCVECEAGLTDEDGVLCPEHAEAQRLRKLIAHDRIANRERMRRYRADRRDELAAKQRAYRQRKRLARQCIDCSQPALDGNSCCVKHAYRRKLRRNGITPIRRKRATRSPDVRRRAVLELAALLRVEVPRLESPLVLVLRALSRLEWPTLGELLDALDVAEHDDTERNTWTQNVVRCVRMGWAERRGKHGARDYQITDEGRAQLRGARREAA